MIVTDTSGLAASDVFDLTVRAPVGGSVITGTAGNDFLSTTSSLNDTFYGLAGDDSIYGGVGDNLLYGQDGNDLLSGQGGNDTAVGGLGNDLYYVDAAGDVIVEAPGEGTDRVYAYVDYALSSDVENLTLMGNVARGTGNAQNNVISKGDLLSFTPMVIDGGGGIDTMSGGLGDDTYYVDNAADSISEYISVSDGTTTYTNTSVDTVMASASYTLAPGLEKLVLLGTAAIDGTGNSGSNTLTGNAGGQRADRRGRHRHADRRRR